MTRTGAAGAPGGERDQEVGMNSSIIGKIEKARRYAEEPERVQINALNASFHGSHDEYTITLQDGHWHCSCHFFESQEYGTCSHVMALQRLLGQMKFPIATEAEHAAPAAPVAG
jgi:hypothetical protein